MITVSHPNVNQYVKALLQALDVKNQLQEFHTTINAGRRNVPIERRKIRQHPYRELARIVCQRLKQRQLTKHDSGIFSIDSVARSFDRQVARNLKACSAVYCYEDSALATFRAAQTIGVRRYYELPIVYWTTAQKLLQEERSDIRNGNQPCWEHAIHRLNSSGRAPNWL